jgi:hypothetical protein
VLRGHDGEPQCGQLVDTKEHGLVLIVGYVNKDYISLCGVT